MKGAQANSGAVLHEKCSPASFRQISACTRLMWRRPAFPRKLSAALDDLVIFIPPPPTVVFKRLIVCC